MRKTKKKNLYIYIYIAFSLFLCRTQYWFKLAILGTTVPPLTGILSAGWRQVAEVKAMAVHHPQIVLRQEKSRKKTEAIEHREMMCVAYQEIFQE